MLTAWVATHFTRRYFFETVSFHATALEDGLEVIVRNSAIPWPIVLREMKLAGLAELPTLLVKSLDSVFANTDDE